MNLNKPTVEIVGFVDIVTRERGKLVQRVSGENIWTLTGREYLSQLMSYSEYLTDAHAGGGAAEDEVFRDDRIRYVGMGTGTTPEVSSVDKLVNPLAYQSGSFLAQLSIPSFPLTATTGSSRTTVRYTRAFLENELSIAGTVLLTEAGLFTDGNPAQGYAPKTRDVTFAQATNQAPVAYKAFEPIRKTQNFVLEIFWEIRF